ncbi:MAG: DUF4956 domain-containing protein [Candidatus Cloacimonetes bacterium]|nr:DUF4956 domain-containing protein [Candidatus Cloacimonadota bacterium]
MQELFEIIKQSSEGSITQSPLRIVINLSMAMILGLIYAYVYRLTYIGKKSNPSIKAEMEGIQYTLLLLSVGGAFIWIVVADNLVRAFGLAGALSLIRFRTKVKDPMNTIKVFYSIIIGMSCGLSQYYAALIGTAFMSFVLTVIYFIKKREKKLKKLKKEMNPLTDDNPGQNSSEN